MLSNKFSMNSSARRVCTNAYSPAVKSIVGRENNAFELIKSWPGYAKTPLLQFDALADEVGVGQVTYKDEASRFGLGSFKALGGAYAVYHVVRNAIEQSRAPSEEIRVSDIINGRYTSRTSAITVASATAGNHGRSVAWGARIFGCRAVIFIHGGVSDERADAIAHFGADVRRVEGDYDESVRIAATHALKEGWTVVSDTSYEGYIRIPTWVMQGYTTLFLEIGSDSPEPPTHVFVQGGVGGLAASAAAYYAERYGTERPTVVIVEPDDADCLYQSVVAGHPRPAAGRLNTMMLGMACGEPSLLAWEVLRETADAALTISDADAMDAMRYLNKISICGRRIVAGECSGAGIAALRAAMADPSISTALQLDQASRVLLIGTEGATDPAAYAAIVGSPPP